MPNMQISRKKYKNPVQNISSKLTSITHDASIRASVCKFAAVVTISKVGCQPRRSRRSQKHANTRNNSCSNRCGGCHWPCRCRVLLAWYQPPNVPTTRPGKKDFCAASTILMQSWCNLDANFENWSWMLLRFVGWCINLIRKVKLFVTKLTSTKTQAPYDYYSLPYCKPASLDLQKENLGQVISGDRIEASTYKVRLRRWRPVTLRRHIHNLLPYNNT